MLDFKKMWPLPAILGLSLILSTFFGSYVFYQVRAMDDVLSVTGSAKVAVKADMAKWSLSFSRTVSQTTMSSGYDLMAKDLSVVKKFFASRGVADSDLNSSTIFMDQNYDYNNSNRPSSEKEYTLRQTIQLSSSDVQKVTDLAKNTKEIVNGGVVLSPNAVEYYYTKLPELRVSLLSAAIKDAQARASKLAESTNRSVGTLKSASTGVVQVLPENSLEVSDYGTYDTSGINKEVMITVRAAFNIK